MDIIKDKNIVTFDPKNGKKPYTLDINTATMFGRNGRALVHVPDEVRKYLKERYKDNSYKDSWLVRVFVEKNNNYEVDSLLGNTALLQLLDKMNSLKYVYEYNISDEVWKYLIENEKDFIKAIVKNPNISVADFYKEHQLEGLFKKFGIKKETFSSSELEYIKRSVTYDLNYSILSKYFDYFCYYTKQGLSELAKYAMITYTIAKYFDMCECLDILPEKTIFTKTFAAVSRLYEEQQEQITKKKLLTYSEEMKDKLFFENDIFTIVVPSCPMDFHKEAEKQDNCVERIYQEKVAYRKTNVVFVRKKENIDDSYITCEVDNTGKIVQYLLSHNRFPCEVDDLKFMNEYQSFLLTTMGQ